MRTRTTDYTSVCESGQRGYKQVTAREQEDVMAPDEQSSAAARKQPEGGAPLDERAAAGDEANDRQAATGNARPPGITDLVAGVTGVAQDRLLRLRDDIVARGEATRDGLQRGAFKTLFPNEAQRLDDLEHRLEIVEAHLAEQGTTRRTVGNTGRDSNRQTGFASTSQVPDEQGEPTI
jgi:hypothetical protein